MKWLVANLTTALLAGFAGLVVVSLIDRGGTGPLGLNWMYLPGSVAATIALIVNAFYQRWKRERAIQSASTARAAASSAAATDSGVDPR